MEFSKLCLQACFVIQDHLGSCLARACFDQIYKSTQNPPRDKGESQGKVSLLCTPPKSLRFACSDSSNSYSSLSFNTPKLFGGHLTLVSIDRRKEAFDDGGWWRTGLFSVSSFLSFFQFPSGNESYRGICIFADIIWFAIQVPWIGERNRVNIYIRL